MSALWSACREWSTAVVRRYLNASQQNETILSHSTTSGSPLEQVQGENFPVAARALPAAFRRDLLAVYSFARLVDDIGDEATGNRSALLDEVSADLDRIYDGQPPWHGSLRDLPATIHTRNIPRAPFDGLIAANRQDQVISRYSTYADLVGYCELSANPVGVLVLYVFGQHTPEREKLSDSICTALQILEHCQDVVEDLDRGRVYLPQEDLKRFGVDEAEFKSPPARAPVRGLLAFQVQRARRLLEDGQPLIGQLHGWARIAVGGYLAGGLATAKAIAEANYDVLTSTPKPAKTATLAHWATVLTSR